MDVNILLQCPEEIFIEQPLLRFRSTPLLIRFPKWLAVFKLGYAIDSNKEWMSQPDNFDSACQSPQVTRQVTGSLCGLSNTVQRTTFNETVNRLHHQTLRIPVGSRKQHQWLTLDSPQKNCKIKNWHQKIHLYFINQNTVDEASFLLKVRQLFAPIGACGFACLHLEKVNNSNWRRESLLVTHFVYRNHWDGTDRSRWDWMHVPWTIKNSLDTSWDPYWHLKFTTKLFMHIDS